MLIVDIERQSMSLLSDRGTSRKKKFQKKTSVVADGGAAERQRKLAQKVIRAWINSREFACLPLLISWGRNMGSGEAYIKLGAIGNRSISFNS